MNSNNSNYEVFRDSLSSVIVEKYNERPQRPPKRKSYKTRRSHTPAGDNVTSSSLPPARANPEDLADFVDVFPLSFLPVTRINTNILTMTVSGFRNLLFPSIHPSIPHLHHSPTNPNTPNNHLSNTTPPQCSRNPDRSSSSFRPRHPNRLRASPLLQRHPGSPPLPAPNRLHQHGHRAPTSMVDDTHGGLRDL